MGECRDLKGSTVRSVVLGIRLTNATVLNRNKIAEEVLKSEKVKKAIHEAFRKQAGALTKASLTGQALDGTAAKAFVQPIGKTAQPEALKQVKKQKEFQEAAQGLRNLKCAFDQAPVGVFVDSNKTWLIIAGVIIGAGGAAAMYMTKSGDVPAKGIAMVTNLAAKKIEIGNVSFGVKDIDFKPSMQNVGGTVGIRVGKLEVAHAKFDISTAIKGGTLQKLMITDTLIVPLTDHTKLSAKAGVGVQDNSPAYDMALAVKHSRKGFTLDVTAYAKGLGPAQTLGGKATAGYRLDTSRILGKDSYTTIGATGNLEASRTGSNSPFQTAGAVNIGLTATFW